MSNQELNKNLDYLIREKFQGLRDEELLELRAEALLYISGHHPSEKELDDKIKDSLLKHLKAHYKERLQEKRGKKFLGRSGVIPASHLTGEFTEGKSDDEILSAELLKLKGSNSWQEESEESNDLELMEQKRDQLEEQLSLFEFEALKMKTSDDVSKRPHYTLGFENLGLFILFRRARIRMIWLERK